MNCPLDETPCMYETKCCELNDAGACHWNMYPLKIHSCPLCDEELEYYPDRMDGYSYRCWNCDVNYYSYEVRE